VFLGEFPLETNEREPLLSSIQALYGVIRLSQDRRQHTVNIAHRCDGANFSDAAKIVDEFSWSVRSLY